MNKRLTVVKILSGLVFLSLLFSPQSATPVQASRLAEKPGPTTPKKNPRKLTQRPGLAPAVVQSTSGQDAFGYHWETGAYSWVNPNTPGWTKVAFSDRDDGSSDPLNLGFTFKYYENSYTQVFLSTNGMLTFGESSASSSNELIPFIGTPNNFIAPFWADLYVGPVPADTPVYTGTVSYQAFPGKFVVAYQNVIRFGALPSDSLSFEVELNNDGKICFNYDALNTKTWDYTTVGIEDVDGVDGLQYFYNNQGPSLTGLVRANSLCFIRPSPRRAVKLLPHYTSSLAIQGKADFKVKLRNIGEAGDDKFDLTYQKSDPNWTVSLYDQNGNTLLVDTSQNSIPDTGVDLIKFGGYFTTTVKISAPANAPIGSSATITLTATSVNCPSCRQSMRMQAAIPAPFAQALVNNDSGIELDTTWAKGQYKTPVSKDFTGSVLSITGKPADIYTMVWEDNEDKIVGERQVSYTNLDVARLSRYGQLLHEQVPLTDNEGASLPTWQINDKSPAVAVSPNGRVGVLWVREIISNTWLLPTDKRNYNIYFTVLENGTTQSPLFEPVNVTGNNSWRGGSDVYNSPYFNSPRLAATSDNHFMLSWSDERTQPSGQQGNVYLAAFDSGGTALVGVQQITQGGAGGDYYKDPTLASLSGSRVLLAYAHLDSRSNPVSIDYQVFNSSAAPQTAPTVLASATGYLPTASQLGGGNILLAWTGAGGQISYAMLNGSYQKIKGPLPLATPDGLLGDYASITLDSQGKAILAWSDTDFYQQLYYAYLDQAGNLLTSPLGFNQVSGSTYLIINNGGNGLGPYTGPHQLSMPLVLR